MPPEVNNGKGFKESDWQFLLAQIKAQTCIPVLGAGACAGALPLANQVVKDWTELYEVPSWISPNLESVSQYLAILKQPMYPKTTFAEMLRNLPLPPMFEPHTTLAKLPLPVYLTTNYDELMEKALKKTYRRPYRDCTPWNSFVQQYREALPDNYVPEAATPLVFHFHGHLDLTQSMVLTEDDYLTFLVKMAKEPDLIPGMVRYAMQRSCLLFIGYGLADKTYRVLHQSLILGMDRAISPWNYAVMPLPVARDATVDERQAAQSYMDKYLYELRITAYYGTGAEFAKELAERLERGGGDI